MKISLENGYVDLTKKKKNNYFYQRPSMPRYNNNGDIVMDIIDAIEQGIGTADFIDQNTLLQAVRQAVTAWYDNNGGIIDESTTAPDGTITLAEVDDGTGPVYAYLKSVFPRDQSAFLAQELGSFIGDFTFSPGDWLL